MGALKTRMKKDTKRRYLCAIEKYRAVLRLHVNLLHILSVTRLSRP